MDRNADYTPTTENIEDAYAYGGENADGTLMQFESLSRAEFRRWLAAHDAEVAAKALVAWSDDPEAMERARKVVEDELIEWRDARLSTMRRNGLAIFERDSTPSSIIRFGFEDGLRIAVRAEATLADASRTSVHDG